MGKWYSRPLLFVSDLDRACQFYVKQLGFREIWRHAEEGNAFIAQVDRDGCELILSSQWPERVSNAIMFISLDRQDVSAVRAEFDAQGVKVREGGTNCGFQQTQSELRIMSAFHPFLHPDARQ